MFLVFFGAGVRIGEARVPGHRERGLTLLTQNVSALETNFRSVDLVETADVVLLQEVRLAARQQVRARQRLLPRWDVQFGAPSARSWQKGRLRVAYGGVAVLARRPHRLVSPAQGLLDSVLAHRGRSVHAMVPYGNGGRMVHVVSIYGHTSAGSCGKAAAHNAVLAEQVLLAASQLGEVPVVIAGDLNQDPDTVPAIILALATGEWYDVAAEWARRSGRPPAATFSKSGQWEDTRVGPGRSRIDVVLANRTAMAAVVDVRQDPHVVPASHHAGIFVKFAWERFTALAPRLQLPPPLRFDAVAPMPDEEESVLATDLLQAVPDVEELAVRDPAAAYALWSGAAEAFLRRRGATSGTGAGVRGLPAKVVWEPLAAPQGHGASAATTCLMRRLLGLRRRLREVRFRLARVLRGEALPDVYMWDLARTIRTLQKDGPRLVPEVPWARVVDLDLELVERTLTASILAEERAAARGRMEKFKRQLAEQTAAVWRVLRKDKAPPVGALQRPDGTMTADPVEVVSMVVEAWRPVFQAIPEQLHRADAFFQEYADDIGRLATPGPEQMPSGADLQAAVRRRSSSTAGGADGWRTTELQALPLVFFDALAAMIPAFATAGWPAALRTVAVSMIDAGKGPRPEDLRGISVLPVVTAIWDSAIFHTHRDWAAAFAPTAVCGAIRGLGTSDVAHSALAALELSVYTGVPRHGILWDKTKCFDRFLPDVTCPLLQHLGMSPAIVNLERAKATTYERFLKLGGVVRAFYRFSNGEPQGSAVTVLQCIALFAVLAARMERSVPSVAMTVYLDDTGTAEQAGDAAALADAVAEVRRFDAVSRQATNWKKTVGWATSARARRALRAIVPECRVTSRAGSLGIPFDATTRASLVAVGAKVEDSIDACCRIAGLPRAVQSRQVYLSGKAVAPLRYLSPFVQLPVQAATRLRTKVVQTLYRWRRGLRSVALVLTLLVPGHAVDPYQFKGEQGALFLSEASLGGPPMPPRHAGHVARGAGRRAPPCHGACVAASSGGGVLGMGVDSLRLLRAAGPPALADAYGLPGLVRARAPGGVAAGDGGGGMPGCQSTPGPPRSGRLPAQLRGHGVPPPRYDSDARA